MPGRSVVSSSPINLPANPDVQWLQIQPQMGSREGLCVIVGNIYMYCPPRRGLRGETDSFEATIEHVANSIRALRGGGHALICVAGDWNCHLGRDLIGEHTIQEDSNSRGRIMHRVLLSDPDLGLQLVTGSAEWPANIPTWSRQGANAGGGSVLDHVVCSDELVERILSVSTDWCITATDHAAITVDLAWQGPNRGRPTGARQYHPRPLHTQQMRQEYWELLEAAMPEQPMAIDGIERCLATTARAVPARPSGLAAVRASIRALWQESIRNLKQLPGGGEQGAARRQVRQLGLAYRRTSDAAVRLGLRQARRQQNPRGAWRIIKAAAGLAEVMTHYSPPVLRTPGGQLTSCAQQTAALLADTYSSVYTARPEEDTAELTNATRVHTHGYTVQQWVDTMAELHWSGNLAMVGDEGDDSQNSQGAWEVSVDEVAAACSRLRRGTACDSHGVRSDYLVNNGKLHESLAQAFTTFLNGAAVPQAWLEARITPVLKSGKPRQEPTSYRPVAMTTTLCRVYGQVLLKRLERVIPDALHPRVLEGDQPPGLGLAQSGFKRDRSCTEAVLSLRELCAARWHRGLTTWIAFTDVSRAYDRLDRQRMLGKLHLAGVPDKLVTAIAALHSGTKAQVDLKQAVSDTFAVPLGTRQGDVLAPRLYSIAVDHLETALLHLSDDEGTLLGGVELDGRRHCVFSFADDVASVSESGAGLQHQLDASADVLGVEGLEINAEKTKVMCIQPHGAVAEEVHITLGGHVVEQVHSYTHLGTRFTDDFGWEPHVEKVTTAASRAMTQLRAMGGKSLPTSTLKQAYMTLVVPHTEYCVALWSRGGCSLTALDALERQALGWILGNQGRIPTAVLRGELGLQAAMTRRDAAVLRLYHNVVSGRTKGPAKDILASGMKDYLRLWKTGRRTQMPPATSVSWLAGVHRTLWVCKKCDTPRGQGGTGEPSLWIGDLLDMDDAHDEDTWDREFDRACAEISHRMGKDAGAGPDLAWLRKLDTCTWRQAIQVSPTMWEEHTSRFISPLYGVIKNRMRMEPYLQDSKSASSRRRQTLWRFRGWLHPFPEIRFERRMRCVVCRDDNLKDIHWHALSDSGCADQRMQEARAALWETASAVTHHAATHSLLRQARESLLLRDRAAPPGAEEMWEGVSLGLRVVLGGWLSKQELGNEPWWPHEINELRREAARQGDDGMCDVADTRESDRRGLTAAAQAWMQAVDDIVAFCT